MASIMNKLENCQFKLYFWVLHVTGSLKKSGSCNWTDRFYSYFDLIYICKIAIRVYLVFLRAQGFSFILWFISMSMIIFFFGKKKKITDGCFQAYTYTSFPCGNLKRNWGIEMAGTYACKNDSNVTKCTYLCYILFK